MANSNAIEPAGAEIVTLDRRNERHHVVTFGLGSETFAIDTARVQEVLDLVPVTPVPNSDRFTPGLINVRGKVIPLADLRVRFGMERAEATLESRILVLEVERKGEPLVVGALADRVDEVTEVAKADTEDAPQVGMRWRAEFIKGIGKSPQGFIIILDIDRVFAASAEAG